MRTSAIVTATAATVIGLGCAYAVYFDYKRRNDANFRKALRRDKKKHQSAQKQQAAAANAAQRQQVAIALRQVAEEGFPTDAEEREGYFMNELAQGELLCQEGPAQALNAALCFYKALKVYPQPKDLITIYDKTVPKHVLDLLAEMIATDGSIPIGGGDSAGHGHGVE